MHVITFVELQLEDNAFFNKRSWIEVDRYLLPQNEITDHQTASVTFSTNDDFGQLLWHGHEPSVPHDGDYLSLKS